MTPTEQAEAANFLAQLATIPGFDHPDLHRWVTALRAAPAAPAAICDCPAKDMPFGRCGKAQEDPALVYKRGYEEALSDCIRNGVTWARSMFANNAEHIAAAPQAEPTEPSDEQIMRCWHNVGGLHRSVDGKVSGAKAFDRRLAFARAVLALGSKK